MNKEDLIIYGASNYGMKVYLSLQNKYNILFFVDGDAKKQGTMLLGKKIYSPEVLVEYKDQNVIIGSSYFDEIIHNLLNIGIKNILKYEESFFVAPYIKDNFWSDLKENKTINLGAFLEEFNKIELKSLTFIPGGSGVLDYAFIKALIQKFNLKNYLEIGTYIGESINVISDMCNVCYSITAPIDAPFSMKNWCKKADIPDYSERLATSENIRHYYCDSKEFNFSKINEKIDLYFIDGDHSYEGVYHDTKNIFETKTEDSFIVWHDFKKQGTYCNEEIILAVKDALNKEFENVFITDNNLCGIYIPQRYQKYFPLKKLGYSEERQELYIYDTLIKTNIDR